MNEFTYELTDRLPSEPLSPTRIRNQKGFIPRDCSGWGYAYTTGKRAEDGSHFVHDCVGYYNGQSGVIMCYPAKYDEKQNIFVVTGNGYALIKGEMVELTPEHNRLSEVKTTADNLRHAYHTAPMGSDYERKARRVSFKACNRFSRAVEKYAAAA